MAKKEIAEVESKIKNILTDRVAEAAGLEERLEFAKQQQKVANEAMDAATTTGDLKSYKKAKSDRNDAEDAIDMYSKRLNALEYRPLISKDEYEECVAQIMTTLGEVSADAKKRIIEHMEQIRIIADECEAEITNGNEVLHQLQHKIYRDKAEQTFANGKSIHMDYLEKRFADLSVPQFANYILNNGSYKNFTRQSE